MKKTALFLFICIAGRLPAQITLPALEGWRLHASYKSNNDLIEVGDKIYVASQNALFTYDKVSHELEVISKVNGLSDVTVKQMEYDPETKTLVVVYDNTNIDLISGNRITNIPEILNQSIMGEKKVNNITIHKSKVYICCSFGIAVVDLVKKKLTDSYMNLGEGGTSIEVFDIAFLNDNIFFAGSNAIYRASENSNNLSDFNSWDTVKSSTFSNHLEVFRNRLYATIDSTLYTYDGITWTLYPSAVSRRTTDMRISNGQLVHTYLRDVWLEDESGQLTVKNITGANTCIAATNGYLYVVANDNYLMQVEPSTLSIDYYGPHGPPASTATRMAYSDNNLWVAAGQVNGFGTNAGWLPAFNVNKFYRFNQNYWYGYLDHPSPEIKNTNDLIDVAIHPDTKNAFFASFGKGIIETNETTVINHFDTSNSSLQGYNSGIPDYQPVFVSGIDFDLNNNMWVSNFGAVEPLSVRTAGGQWYSFPFPTNVDNRIGFITCDDDGNKWMMSTRGLGIVAFNENRTFDYTQDDKIKVLVEGKQNGDLPSNTVFCITKDQKGELWIGTSKGLGIISNPGNVFKADADFDARQIVIKTGLVYSNFLGGIPIYCIRTDAANRKWIGTSNGVWLVSSDGYTVLRNFTVSNSPLLSNIVYEVGIDNSTGEVFFATEKGIVSYMGTATDAGDRFGDVLVYPNPVRPEYTGLIAIKGLVSNAYVKITDITGNLVYETRANGGTATWNGLNFSGRRAATGVYLVFSANEDGTETNVTKILFIN